MALHLVTGYAGQEHVTANDQASWQMATYSSGEFVLNRGNKFAVTTLTNNSLTVADGEAMMQGRYIKLNPQTTEEITIDNGSMGKMRNDIICIQYSKDTESGVETASLVVVKGTEADDNPTDPELTTGSITDGSDAVNQMALWRVRINGLAISSIERMYDLKASMMDNDFVLVNNATLTFTNRQCRINDARVTANSLADVYFTNDSIEAADEADVSVESYNGYLLLTAVKNPNSTIKATIFVRAVL